MSVPALSMRPAVDTRPPAQPWVGAPETTGLIPANQPTLHLVLSAASDEPSAGAAVLATPSVLARMPLTVDVVPAGADSDQQPALVEQAHTWAPWFAQLLVEALDGRRPLDSLSRWLDEWVLAEVSRRVRLLHRARLQGRPVPPASVVSLRTQFTHRRVLEVAVHLHRGGRSVAWAFQLVRLGERWRCTALVVDPLPRPRSASAQPASPNR